MSSLLVVISILYCYRKLFYFGSGNHIIYEIVQQGFYELRIDMADFNSESRYAVYKRFYIGGETTGYQLHVEDYEGTAGRYCNFPACPFINQISIYNSNTCSRVDTMYETFHLHVPISNSNINKPTNKFF